MTDLEEEVQPALFPAPEPSPWRYVEQPVQDTFRLARPVVTVWAEPFL